MTARLKTVHLSKLTAYIVSEFHRTPAEAALRDFGDIFMVERIVEADKENDVKGPVSSLKFKVAWLGFPGEDTTEPWKELRNLEQFREFLVSHHEKSYRDLVRKLPRCSQTADERKRENLQITRPTVDTENIGTINDSEKRRSKGPTGKKVDDDKTRDWTWNNLKRMPLRRSDRKPRKTTRLIEEDGRVG